ncbi:ParB/RepB/Spo0J family partition protein [Liberiplasma polymorphum]|uniref:ParB/RepB/Spo0J family partition protein n=1 Tax=Liberiplasma polymorphum TaxID=3374570 RepID=UPI0037747DBE
MNKDILGRNIEDLIEENKLQIKDNEEIIDINITDIKPNPNQPRVNFDSTALKQLADSIKEHGVIQPVILKPYNNGFILVAGERRVRASIIAGKKTVPAIIRDYNSIYLTELSILENLQREDLTPIEEAIAFERAIKNLGLTQAELGKKIGKSRSYVTNMIGLLNLPITIIEDVNKGLISMAHARVLSKLEDIEFIDYLANKIKKEQITVRKLEELVRKKKNKVKNNKRTVDSDIKEMHEVATTHFQSQFGANTKVQLTNNSIKIKFKDSNHLKEIINKMKG